MPPRLRERVTFCLDTCHVFAAGYDLSSAEGYAETMASFERELGLSLLEAFHLNDSKKPLGCRVDRHENPGKGCIGRGAFERLLGDARFETVPGFLELPPEQNLACLAELRAWRPGGARGASAEPDVQGPKPHVRGPKPGDAGAEADGGAATSGATPESGSPADAGAKRASGKSRVARSQARS